MIEILATRCTACNTCVSACPDHVFDVGSPGELPLIARPDQCQTCFLCELYCPQDAIYVAVGDPDAIPRSALDSDPVGRIRHDYGWDGGTDDPLRYFWKLGPLLRQGVEISSARYALLLQAGKENGLREDGAPADAQAP
ncbi:hypothetical protein GOB93_19535 [Acetobacter musti]|uniref:4Fe-4S ferredoxin-type domain-containing protein n=1 Tax=Acetobacter musti TaxID=864732 RepID=A0ABX0JU69_9PROT|nr:hypothetical protein [Acetobacter musti]